MDWLSLVVARDNARHCIAGETRKVARFFQAPRPCCCIILMVLLRRAWSWSLKAIKRNGCVAVPLAEGRNSTRPLTWPEMVFILASAMVALPMLLVNSARPPVMEIFCSTADTWCPPRLKRMDSPLGTRTRGDRVLCCDCGKYVMRKIIALCPQSLKSTVVVVRNHEGVVRNHTGDWAFDAAAICIRTRLIFFVYFYLLGR